MSGDFFAVLCGSVVAFVVVGIPFILVCRVLWNLGSWLKKK